ncbi:MAG: adenylosuccinate synthetase [Kouleothrix sp.]
MRHAFLTVDLGFGDAGKGAVVDFLTRQYAAHTVVPRNGGAQAGHRRWCCPAPKRANAVLTSSAAARSRRSHASRAVLVEPLAMLAEARTCAS